MKKEFQEPENKCSPGGGRDSQEELLNQFTELNNELVNAQRILVKQNEEIKLLNKKLEGANRNLKEYSYAISHDIKEPLRMVVGFLSLLKREYSSTLDSKGEFFLQTALNGGVRLQKMILDLAHLFSLSEDKPPLSSHKVKNIIEEALLNLDQAIKDSDAQIELSPELPCLRANRSDISRLFQNLVSNAIKFRRKDAKPLIIINAEDKGGHWIFSVKDNGSGIPIEYANEVFKVFKRLHSSEEAEGSGMGLALCKRIVSRHGGEIWIEPNPEGGSVFYFTIKKL